jgi:soluble lytic murein transglycosylase-like protein
VLTTHALLLSMLLAPAADAQQTMQSAMEASIAKQKLSVSRQVNGAPPPPGEWFTVAWPGSVDAFGPSIEEAEESACARIPPDQLEGYLEEVARREGFTPDLLRAVIDRESGFDPCAVSVKGAQGLMQLMPETAAELGVRNTFDPVENINGGARFLGQLLERYRGNIAKALAAYNAGPARVDTYRGLPPIPETLNYVSSIMEKLRVEPLTASESPDGL